MLKPLPALILLTLGGLIVGWLLFAALARLTGADVDWWWPQNGSLPDDQLFDVTRSSATIAALFGGLYAILYAYRKQRVEEAAGHRADAEGLSTRYQEAAQQLGHDKAAVRLAGVYAMARLGDEWLEQRQTCVDVLCAYLRMPQAPLAGGERDEAEHQVRRSIVAAINKRISLANDRVDTWSSCDFDFSTATLRDFQLADAVFRGAVTFHDTTFEGVGFLNHVLFTGTPRFLRCSIAGSLALSELRLGPQTALRISGCKVEQGGRLSLLTCLEQEAGSRNPSLGRLTVEGEFRLNLGYSRLPQPPLRVSQVELVGGNVEVTTLRKLPHGRENKYLPEVDAYRWKIDSSESVEVANQLISDGVFRGRRWEGDVPVKFRDARLAGPGFGQRPSSDKEPLGG